MNQQLVLEEHEVKHTEIIRECAAECTVLLKKDGQFPLTKPGRIALVGSGARRTVKGGTGSGEVNSHFYITVEEGLRKAGFTIVSDEWLNAYDAVKDGQEKEHIAYVRGVVAEKGLSGLLDVMGMVTPEPDYDFNVEFEADAALYVLARNSGEGADRKDEKGDFRLSDTEIRDILKMAAYYPKFMLVLNLGSVVDLTPVIDAVPNILLLSQLGVVTGDVLVDIVLGKKNPSGKLTTSWAEMKDYPSSDNFEGFDETRYEEGIYVGYRYFSTVGKKTVFPFGYGLSYTEFSMLAADFCAGDGHVCLQVQIQNTGNFAGKETAEIYVTKPEGRLPQPLVVLADYQKSGCLLPGETESLQFRIPLASLASFDEEAAAYVLEEGDYVFLLGKNAEDLTAFGTVRIPERVITKRVKHIGGKPDFSDRVFQRNQELIIPEKLPVVSLNPACIVTETVSYDYAPEIDPFAAALSDEDCAALCVGSYQRDKQAAMIGNSGNTVVGAAGETILQLKEVGLNESLVLADGPAGLRLNLTYGEDAEGKFLLSDALMERLKAILPEAVLQQFGMNDHLKKRQENCSIHTQYCTAIPIGTAIAQSFNSALAESFGDIVGTEMEMYGVHLWLAPGMNIHRTPLCGRNFEYYSEDPLVSGRMAAAVTRGVQRHPGCGTTIKHFCCNNQEFRRTNNNSQLSERALREVYLCGFEIAVKLSHPHALMSSYNLVNGMHTSERRDLITDFLRSECGFDGLIMTDWIGTNYDPGKGKYRNGCAAPTMAAGNELFCPGCQADVDDILRALREGELTREKLNRNASTVYRMIRKLNSRE